MVEALNNKVSFSSEESQPLSVGEDNTGFAFASHRIFDNKEASASAQSLKAIYVKYRDHVFFRNVASPAAEPIERETIGWVKQETDEFLLIECDRPLLQAGSGFNGVVVIKNCIISMFEVPLQGVSHVDLNCAETKKKAEYALSAKGSEKLSSQGAIKP